MHPSKPRLALNVGVTGNWPDRLPEDCQPLEKIVSETLQRIATIFAQVAAWPKTLETHDLRKKPALRLLSPLSGGSGGGGWMTVRCAQSLGYEWQCPLPFSVRVSAEEAGSLSNKFTELLGQATRVVELDGGRLTERERTLAYWRLESFVLRHSDILLAIWDGDDDTRSGGTADTVARAERDQVPTVRILLQTPYSVEFRDHQLTKNTWQALTDFDLEKLLRSLLLPPDLRSEGCRKDQTVATPVAAEGDSAERVGRDDPKHGSDNIRVAYFAHAEPKLTLVASAHRLFFAWFGKHRFRGGLGSSYQDGATSQWQTVEEALEKLPQSVQSELRGSVREHFLWADRLATYYADEYRGTFTLMFSLASLAVVLALLSGPFPVFAQWLGQTTAARLPCLAIGELLVIFLMVGLWYRSHKGHFHERWLDFRLLAELLRQRVFLLPIGGIATLDMPDYVASGDSSCHWVAWMARGVSREEGLPALPVGGFNEEEYRSGYTEYLAHMLKNQIEYHECNAKRNRSIATSLQRFDGVLLWLIIIACVGHIIDHTAGLHLPGLADLTVIAAAALPAFGATAHGLFSHGEFKRIASRSKGMEQRLTTIESVLSDTNAGSLSAAKLENVAVQAIDTMSQELSDWRVIFRAKPLELAT